MKIYYILEGKGMSLEGNIYIENNFGGKFINFKYYAEFKFNWIN